MSSVLIKPLQLPLWGPLQPPRVELSQAAYYDGGSRGAFSNAFSFAFDVANRYEFSSAFSKDFATVAFTREQSFSNAFSTDFDTVVA